MEETYRMDIPMEKQRPTDLSIVDRSGTDTPAASQCGVGAIGSRIIVEVGWCTCCIVLCAVLSVVLSWPFGKKFCFVVSLRPFVLGHEVLFVLFLVLSWPLGMQFRFVVCLQPSVLGHEVLSWSSAYPTLPYPTKSGYGVLCNSRGRCGPLRISGPFNMGLNF